MEQQKRDPNAINENNVIKQVGWLGKTFVNKTKNGSNIANFSVAIITGKDEQSGKMIYTYFNWKAFEKNADTIASLNERQKVKLIGTPAIETYKNKDGIDVTKNFSKLKRIEVINDKTQRSEA